MNLSAVRRLTIQAKTEGFPQATSDLNRLSDAQASVATTGQTMATVTDVATRKQLSAAQAYQRQTLALDEQARMQDRLAKQMKVADQALQQGLITQQQYAERLQLIKASLSTPANDNFARSTRQNTEALKNFGYQANDVVQGLLTGQRPFQILLQQGGQIQQAFGQHSGGAAGVLKEFGSTLVGLITPLSVLITGIVGMGAATTAATLSWQKFALALDDTAKQAGITSAEMAKLQAAASFKGIGQADFASAASRFSSEIYQARNNVGSLAELLRANGVPAVRDFGDGFSKVADLVQRASNDQQRLVVLQQAGLPATMEWVRLMGQGAAGLQRAKDAAVQFGGALNDEMVRKAREFDDIWNKFTTNFGLYWRNFGLGAIATLDLIFTGLKARIAEFLDNPATKAFATIISMGFAAGKFVGSLVVPSVAAPASPTRSISGVASGSAGVSLATTIDPEILKRQLGLEQQRIGILGQMATVSQQVRQVEISIQMARLAGVNVAASEEKAILGLVRAQALGTYQINAQADAQRIEIATVGMSTAQAIAYRAVWDRVYEAKRNGHPLNEQEIRDLQQSADTMANLAVRALALRSIEQSLSSAFAGMVGDIAAGVNAMDAMIARASQLGKALTDIGSKSLFDTLKGGLSGNGFSFDPVSLGAGVIGMGISAVAGWLKSQNDAEKEAQKAKEAWAGMTDQMNQFIRAADGFDLSNFASAIYQAKQTLDQLWVAAMKANDTMGAMRVANAFAQTVWSQMDAFARSVGPAKSDAATAIETQQRAAKQLIQSMQDVGFYSEQAGATIRDNLAKQIAYLQDQASKSLVADINSATGKGFINDINSLLEKYNQLKQDASITGVDTSLIDRWFTVQAQKVVDDTGLIGDSFNELLRLFPNLTGKVNESADALQKAADAQAEYQNSLNQTARSIVDYLNNLNAGAESTLSPTQRLYAAQSAFQSTLGLAQGNDQQALARITSDADNWLKAARDVFASGAGYQSILQQIQSQLAGLPAVQTSTDPVVQALLNVQGVMQNVLTGINNVNGSVGGVASGVNNVKLSVDSTTGMVTATRDAVNGTTGAIGGTTSAVNANTGSTYNIVDKTVDRLNVAIERFSSAVSLLSQTVNALNDSVALLDAIRGLQDTSKQQLQILASQNRASSFTTSQWNGFGVGVGGRFDPVTTSTSNSMLEALNKIAFNTYATSLNTANLAAVGTSSANRVLIGTFATGGTLGAGGFGIFGEHHPDGPWLMKAGANPVPITPALPTFASNDNSAMVAELRALRAEVANLQRVVAASGNQVTRAVVAASDENVAVTEDAGKRMAFELSRTARDNKVA